MYLILSYSCFLKWNVMGSLFWTTYILDNCILHKFFTSGMWDFPKQTVYTHCPLPSLCASGFRQRGEARAPTFKLFMLDMCQSNQANEAWTTSYEGTCVWTTCNNTVKLCWVKMNNRPDYQLYTKECQYCTYTMYMLVSIKWLVRTHSLNNVISHIECL